MSSSFSLIDFLESVVYSDRKDALARIVRGILLVLSGVYQAVIWLYLLPFVLGWRKRKRLPCPVISVGNITSGGTGKTPVVQYICRGLEDHGLSPAALSYGYGGILNGKFGIVSDKKRVLLDAEMAGDEPAMLAYSLPGVPVAVCKDRYKSGTAAIQDLGADVLVLDDGFQVWKLERDFEIVLVSSNHPFDNGHTLPAGLLRESLSSLRRADCLIATGSCNPESLECILETVEEINPKLPVFTGRYRPAALYSPADGRVLRLDAIRGKRVLALSSIANPLSFEGTLDDLGAKIVGEERFHDHHAYFSDDIRYINKQADDVDATFVVTTEKDAIKLDASQFSVPLLVLRIEVELDPESEFWDAVAAALEKRSGSGDR